jgi:hypothetical protein
MRKIIALAISGIPVIKLLSIDFTNCCTRVYTDAWCDINWKISCVNIHKGFKPLTFRELTLILSLNGSDLTTQI